MLSPRAREGLTVAGLLGIVTFFFFDILLAGLNLYTRDIPLVYYPERAVLRTILRAGALPLWNHFASGGQPLAANPGYEAFYPLQWLVALGPLRDMFHLEIVLHYLIAALGMYLFGRALGLSRIASAYGGLAWALGGLMLALSNLLPFLFSAAWLPWVGFTFRRYLMDGGVRRLAFVALPLAMIFLAADVSMMMQTCALLVAYAIHHARRTGAWRRALASCVAAGLIACAIAAVQLIPALDFQRDSGRAVPLSLAVATRWSMPPVRLAELIWPAAFGSATPDAILSWGSNRLYPEEGIPFYFSIYPGIVSVLLVGAGFLRRIRGAGLTALVAVVSFAMAMGKYGPLFPLCYRLGMHSLRYPEKFAVAGIFALSAFAMVNADAVLRDAAMQRAAFRIGLVIAAITLPIIFVTTNERFARLWRLPSIDPFLASRFRHGMLMTLVFTIMAITIFRATRLAPRLRLLLLAATAVVDLGLRVTSTMPRTTADFYTPPPAARALAGTDPVRIYSYAGRLRTVTERKPLPFGVQRWIVRNGMIPSSEMTWGFEGMLDLDVTSTHLLPTVHFENLFNAALTHPRLATRLPLLLQMSGVTHVGFQKDYDPAVLADPSRFDTIDPVEFVATRNAGPFYIADRLLPLADTGRVLASTQRLSPRTTFTDAVLPPAPARVIASRVSPNRVAVDVDASGRSFLSLAVTRHKYWSATIDGAPATLHPANVAFQGVVIERGRHHLELVYRNPVIVICGWISIAALLATIAVAAVPRRAPSTAA
ncbi:MAG: YfhO family protein [Thermoanaerobaculia bacterium]